MQVGQIADEQIMTLYQNGSETAFQCLYDRHSGKIYAFLKKRISNQEKVNEIFQEVFFKIHRSKHLYKNSFPVLPWIFTITKSVMIDELRKEKRKVIVSDYDLEAIPAPVLDHVDEGPFQVLDVINRLPESQKVAMHLRYSEEKTFTEIAEVLATSEMNARKLVSRGIQRIKELIQDGGNS